jgi:serine/threonine protein phosphatase PrpC
VPPETLREIMASGDELTVMAQLLVSTALEHGSRDNITALVVRCAGGQDADGC